MTTSIWSFAKRAEPTRSGLVTARHPLAAAAGRELLRAGGNAVDAAIATILATGVVHPFATGLGGGGLLTVCGPDDGAASQTLDYRAEAPAAASPTCFELAGEPSVGLLGWAGVAGRANEIGPRSVGVPGTVTGLLAAHDRFGRAPWSDIVGPALVLARSGFETDWYAAMMQASHLEELGRYAPTARAFLRDGRFPYRPAMVGDGDRFRQPALAATLADLAAHGPDAGLRVGESIVTAADGGLITADDIRDYQPRWGAAVPVPFRQRQVYGPAHGGLYELLLRVLDLLPTAELPPVSTGRLHLVIEALRRCRHFESLHLGDGAAEAWRPAYPGLAAEMAAGIRVDARTDDWRDAEWARPPGAEPRPVAGPGRTAHVCVVDAAGTAVSLTETILSSYGSMVTTSSGFLLNNAMFGFVPVAGTPNSVRARARAHSNMSPLVACDGKGRPSMVVGASGGMWISSAVCQVLTALCDFGLSPQDAVDLPRVDVQHGRTFVDANCPDEVVAGLTALGHDILLRERSLSATNFGNVSAIAVDESGVRRAGLEPGALTASAAA